MDKMIFYDFYITRTKYVLHVLSGLFNNCQNFGEILQTGEMLLMVLFIHNPQSHLCKESHSKLRLESL